MTARHFALYGGAVMLLLGVASLIPGWEGSLNDLIPLQLETSYARFLGIFPMNVVNKLALLAFGLAGIFASQTADLRGSLWFSKAVFWVMGIAAILGIPEATRTVGGFWPLYGAEVVSHGFFALVGGYFAYVWEIKAKHENVEPIRRAG